MTNALRDGHLQYRLYFEKGTPHRLLLLPRFWNKRHLLDRPLRILGTYNRLHPTASNVTPVLTLP
jgi:hypothetical protein